MCKVSDNLKLCTCTSEIDSLKHYWVLHRFIDGQINFVLGEIMMPYVLSADLEKYNRSLLEKLLNNGNVFDVEMNPSENDRLELSFTIVDEIPGSVQYGFMYKNQKWVKKKYDVFEWMKRHEADLYGEIKDALQK